MRYQILLFLLPIVLLTCGCGTGDPPLIPNTEIKSIELEVRGAVRQGESATIKFTDKDEIRSIVELLNTGQENEDHKCPDVGRFEIVYPKDKIRIGILPGHNDKFYEFRLNGKNFKVKRSSFLKLLEGKKIDLEKLLQTA